MYICVFYLFLQILAKRRVLIICELFNISNIYWQSPVKGVTERGAGQYLFFLFRTLFNPCKLFGKSTAVS